MEAEKTFDFVYDFRSNGSIRRLKLPLKLPYVGNARELALRVIMAHKLPQHLEDDLHDQLLNFARGASQEMMDKKAEERMVGGSVFEKVSEVFLLPNSSCMLYIVWSCECYQCEESFHNDMHFSKSCALSKTCRTV